MVTGANLTPHLVPEFRTGRPMQSREPLQPQDSINYFVTPVLETKNETTPPDPINRLPEVVVGIKL